MKQFLGYIIKKAVGKGKVSPTIKSVKPSVTVRKKGIKASLDKTRSDEYRKRYTALDKAEGKLKTGKQMMREGQKERKKLIDTGRAVQFKHTKTVSAIKPGEKDRFKGLTTEEKPKKFKKGKELDRENKMGGGMMGRRFGMKKGTPNPFKKETDVDKIKKTFAPKGKVKFDAKKSDLDKSGSLSPYEKRRGMAIAKAMAKRKKVI